MVLGIESTAHTFGVGIAAYDANILANENSIYRPTAGGIHPREAAEHHAKVAANVVSRAIEKSGVKLSDIEGIAIALGPGMGPCLRVGATIARALSYKLSVPLIPVNHAIAHFEIARCSTRLFDPLIVFVSGGNTMISAYEEGRYRVFGETLDISLGNCLDTFAREVGLGFPGTPILEKITDKAKEFIELPYTVKGQDLSFSGLLTAALRAVKEGAEIEDISMSIIETAYAMVVEVTERALVHTGKREVVLTGGVARSKRLTEMLKTMVKVHKAKFGVVPPQYAGDNGAMIALTGALELKYGITMELENSFIRPKWRVEQIDIPWYYYYKELR